MGREEDKNNTWKEEKIRFGHSKEKKYICENRITGLTELN